VPSKNEHNTMQLENVIKRQNQGKHLWDKKWRPRGKRFTHTQKKFWPIFRHLDSNWTLSYPKAKWGEELKNKNWWSNPYFTWRRCPRLDLKSYHRQENSK
jgi:hypothetical protein